MRCQNRLGRLPAAGDVLRQPQRVESVAAVYYPHRPPQRDLRGQRERQRDRIRPVQRGQPGRRLLRNVQRAFIFHAHSMQNICSSVKGGITDCTDNLDYTESVKWISIHDIGL